MFCWKSYITENYWKSHNIFQSSMANSIYIYGGANLYTILINYIKSEKACMDMKMKFLYPVYEVYLPFWYLVFEVWARYFKSVICLQTSKWIFKQLHWFRANIANCGFWNELYHFVRHGLKHLRIFVLFPEMYRCPGNGGGGIAFFFSSFYLSNFIILLY